MQKPDVVLRDIQAVAKNTSDFFLSDASNINEIEIFCSGPSGSPFEGGLFKLKVNLPSNYPFQPPKFFFKDKIFHPNTCPLSGRVCVDLLDDKWSPSITLSAACEIIHRLMTEPNPDSPLNVEAALMMRNNREMYDRTALTWTKHFANGINAYKPFEDDIETIAALNGNEEEAVIMLTEDNWEVAKTADRVI